MMSLLSENFGIKEDPSRIIYVWVNFNLNFSTIFVMIQIEVRAILKFWSFKNS